MIAPTLVKLGVPADRYIKINIETGEFVTGKSPEETHSRFEQMYPGDIGWLQICGRLVDE